MDMPPLRWPYITVFPREPSRYSVQNASDGYFHEFLVVMIFMVSRSTKVGLTENLLCDKFGANATKPGATRVKNKNKNLCL